jgi:hypothetical protein
MVSEGKRVPELLRTQVRERDKLDKYTRYLSRSRQASRVYRVSGGLDHDGGSS